MTCLIDADDLKDGPPTDKQPLREIILAQGLQETGIFVLLFTSETAKGDGAQAGQAADLVERRASELGVDMDTLTLFSDHAYLLQATLGEAALDRTA